MRRWPAPICSGRRDTWTSRPTATFHTRSGVLTAKRQGDMIWLDFPATPVRPATMLPDLERAVGAPIKYLGRTAFDYFIEIESEAAVRALEPDLTLLARLPVRGVVVTARSSDGRHDFVSRFFAPSQGIPEDPVTGSAHCGLGPFWAARLGTKSWPGTRRHPAAEPSWFGWQATGYTSEARP